MTFRVARRLVWLSGLLLLLASAACESDLSGLRRHTYPQDFHYLTRDQLRTTMGQLAERTHELDYRMRKGEKTGEFEGDRIAEVLRNMEQISQALGPGDLPSNRPEVSANVEQLREDIRRARVMAEASPPRYYRAGAVSGAACILCHGPRA